MLQLLTPTTAEKRPPNPGCTEAVRWVLCRFTPKCTLSWDHAGVEDCIATRTEGVSQMRSSHTLTGIETSFDEGNLVANAELLAPGAFAQRLGVAELVDAHLQLPADAVGRAHGGNKAMTVIGAMLAGCNAIADIDILRAGAGRELFDQSRAPSTIGTWLRGFIWASVRMHDRVSWRVPARSRAAGPGPGP